MSDGDDRWAFTGVLSFGPQPLHRQTQPNFLAMENVPLIFNVYDNYDNTVIIIIIYHAAADWNCLCGTKPFRLREKPCYAVTLIHPGRIR